MPSQKKTPAKRIYISAPVPPALKEDIDRSNKELSDQLGFLVETSDIIRMAVVLYLNHINDAIKDKRIISMTMLENALNEHLSPKKK